MASKKTEKPPAPEGGEGEGEGAPAKKKLAGKTLVLFVILPVLLLLGGGGAAAFMLMKPKGEAHAEDGHKADKAHKKEKKKDKKEAHGKGGHDAKGGGGAKVTEGEGVYYVALDPMLVNIGADAGRPAVLKLRLTLEAPDEETAHMVEPHLPRITDQFLGFLRELRTDDIAGSAGTVRLRLELLRRVNIAIAPAQMNGVLIEEMLVQ